MRKLAIPLTLVFAIFTLGFFGLTVYGDLHKNKSRKLPSVKLVRVDTIPFMKLQSYRVKKDKVLFVYSIIHIQKQKLVEEYKKQADIDLQELGNQKILNDDQTSKARAHIFSDLDKMKRDTCNPRFTWVNVTVARDGQGPPYAWARYFLESPTDYGTKIDSKNDDEVCIHFDIDPLENGPFTLYITPLDLASLPGGLLTAGTDVIVVDR